jgi:hypothetical protein
MIFVDVDEKIISAENLRNLDELVIIVVPVEKWLLAKDLGKDEGQLQSLRRMDQP